MWLIPCWPILHLGDCSHQFHSPSSPLCPVYHSCPSHDDSLQTYLLDLTLFTHFLTPFCHLSFSYLMFCTVVYMSSSGGLILHSVNSGKYVRIRVFSWYSYPLFMSAIFTLPCVVFSYPVMVEIFDIWSHSMQSDFDCHFSSSPLPSIPALLIIPLLLAPLNRHFFIPTLYSLLLNPPLSLFQTYCLSLFSTLIFLFSS